MDTAHTPVFYLFSDLVSGVAVAAHLDLEVLKQCASEQGYADWLIRDGKSLDSNVVAQAPQP